jgi:hypothetical protein
MKRQHFEGHVDHCHNRRASHSYELARGTGNEIRSVINFRDNTRRLALIREWCAHGWEIETFSITDFFYAVDGGADYVGKLSKVGDVGHILLSWGLNKKCNK